MNFEDLNDKSVLITGGTGSFGKELTRILIHRFPKIKRIVIFSRDELKQFEMEQIFPVSQYPFMRYFIGDVRDKDRLKRACREIDIIIHAAALKQVPAAEYNPMECIKTNVLGAENVLHAALETNSVNKVIALSTDKAAAPVNLYGATKLCADKLFVAANNMRGKRDLIFSVVRYGNVMGSRGSVIPFFFKNKKNGFLPITDPEMTRFNIRLFEAVELVLYAVANAWGGEIFVPKIPSYRVTDLATAICPDCEQQIVGIRQGEKIHEEMITSADSFTSVDIGAYYVILPHTPLWNKMEYMKKFSATEVKKGFTYNSGQNSQWLSSEDLKTLINTELLEDSHLS